MINYNDIQYLYAMHKATYRYTDKLFKVNIGNHTNAEILV